MTLESMILQRLGARPVQALDLGGVDQDDLALTLKFMVARRQICMQAGWISLYWHRHQIRGI
ncbi:hypothetical protein [Sphingobium sp.]|uniref:hypothetical protein n=1 Tax=Sphingobium sp. TaxID=1912891 RepID=UPI002B5968AD|nr:hypothetical protein [Sphingobium sp.]HUD93409.1 hypothetical protein [Sphingobium sp.]